GLAWGGEAACADLAALAACVHAAAALASTELAARLHACRDWPAVAEEALARLELRQAQAEGLESPAAARAAELYGKARKAAARHGLRNGLIGLTGGGADLAL